MPKCTFLTTFYFKTSKFQNKKGTFDANLNFSTATLAFTKRALFITKKGTFSPLKNIWGHVPPVPPRFLRPEPLRKMQLYALWQESILRLLQEKINILIRENQIRAVKAENRKFKRGSKEWWRTVNKITGRSINVDRVSSVIDPGRMNEFFQKINTDTHYTTPVPLLIPEGTRIPTVHENSVKNIMINLKRTGPGPDGFPYWLWKDFASYLAPGLKREF